MTSESPSTPPPAAPVRGFGAIIVGDEILSGKRKDKHLAQLIGLLSERGLALSWARYLGDDRGQLVAALRESFAGQDVVFSFGGIGATPDDHTRQAAALALGRALRLHPLAEQRIAERCVEMAAQGRGSADMTTPENRQRLRMGEFPEGARIIENPYNRIPGFSVADHWFLPGFPVMAWPMAAAVLDGTYRHLHHRAPVVDRSLLVHDVPESRIAPLMEAVGAAVPGVRVYSLPSVGEDGSRPHIELGIKGSAEAVDAAWPMIENGVKALVGPKT
ncbi:MAG: competence/damage-inducible protein A [Lautropia sp.]